MLVLTRRVNEMIMIGEDIAITIVSVQGHGPHAQVRLGITAPREMTVLRREVYDAAHGAAHDAAHGDGAAARPRGPLVPEASPGGGGSVPQ